MVLEVLGLIFEFIGTALIAISVFRVHWKIYRERKIDKKVILQIKKEVR